MRVKTVLTEDYTNYKEPCMLIGTISCGGKCCIEAGIPLSVCQNDGWRSCAPIVISDRDICERYLSNPITKAICLGGLEPMEQFEEVFSLISTLRFDYRCSDTVVIYTGYREDEIENEVNALRMFENIIIKFGRFRPNQKPHYDEALGVNLASDNQYAKKIS